MSGADDVSRREEAGILEAGAKALVYIEERWEGEDLRLLMTEGEMRLRANLPEFNGREAFIRRQVAAIPVVALVELEPDASTVTPEDVSAALQEEKGGLKSRAAKRAFRHWCSWLARGIREMKGEG